MARLFYKIGEASKETDLPAHVLRFWETEFPQLHPKKGAGGQRVYSREDIALIREIQKLLYKEGCTIPGARKRLSGRQSLASFPDGTLSSLRKELEEIRAVVSR